MMREERTSPTITETPEDAPVYILGALVEIAGAAELEACARSHNYLAERILASVDLVPPLSREQTQFFLRQVANTTSS